MALGKKKDIKEKVKADKKTQADQLSTVNQKLHAETQEIKYLKSKVDLDEEQLPFLTYKNPNLVDCTLINEQDYFTLRFNTESLRPFDAVQELETYEKCIALVNVAELENLFEEYSFQCYSSNLMMDVSLKPKVIERGLAEDKNNFLEEYKALCSNILGGAYAQEDYLKGGKDLFSKKAAVKGVDLEKIRDVQSTGELREYLVGIAKSAQAEKSERYVLMDKRKAYRNSRLMPVLTGIAVISLALAAYLYFIRDNFNETIITANNQYLAEQYTDVTETLSGIDADNLPIESKYILARSYLTTENLTDRNNQVQRENIMKGITLKADERVLSYWIEVGRLNFDKAIDYAKQLNDNDMLLYALVKQKDSITMDVSMSGSEKEKKLSEIEQGIEAVKEAKGMKDTSENTNTNNTGGEGTSSQMNNGETQLGD